MNIAVVFAGGTGQRMNTKSVPKQFLELYGKPIIIYTLEVFENHKEIDAIVAVCLEGWIPYLQKLIKKFQLEKVCAIVPGGSSGQESILHGLDKAQELFPADSIVLIHDGVRPLIDNETITANIESVKKNGSAVTITPTIETTVQLDGMKISSILNRESCKTAKAPQSFFLKDILACHEKAKTEGKDDFIDSASMAQYYGVHLFGVEGKRENIKITTPMDYYLFRAILDAHENSQIFGI